ncbi:hypothetical protein PTTG_10950 [Puccinia triticina 1-1 BBBD Race 1]|uniref:Glycogen [starch] synthase n=1 Tax=Puccinia triticina (isolate 1-1 / race 1 (BBBD)) TaxID=630390 RepID=A0A0C4FCJ6_PUCT1|nr:hypothetical protein PTTG_10950 [Puccinia triticina 1-1 BBBD Race 1]
MTQGNKGLVPVPAVLHNYPPNLFDQKILTINAFFLFTVIKTKAPVTCHKYGDQYCLLGPLAYKSAPMEVEAIKPDTPKMRDLLQSMKDCGVKYLYGRWLIEGGPQVLLFDTGSMMSCLDKWKTNLWNLAGIPAPPNNSEANNTIVFGYLVAWFLGAVRRMLFFSPSGYVQLEALNPSGAAQQTGQLSPLEH